MFKRNVTLNPSDQNEGLLNKSVDDTSITYKKGPNLNERERQVSALYDSNNQDIKSKDGFFSNIAGKITGMFSNPFKGGRRRNTKKATRKAKKGGRKAKKGARKANKSRRTRK